MTTSRLDSAVAVTGMACRFPAAGDVQTFWQNLCGAKSAIRRFDFVDLRRAGVSDSLLRNPHFVPVCAPIPVPHAFDAAHFGIAPSAARLLDLQHRVLLECAWTALETSGTFASKHRAVGVFAGCSDSRLDTFAEIRKRDQSGTLAVPVGSSTDYLAARLAFTLDLQGPAVTVRAACATSLVAVHLAVSSLLSNECDVALAGAVAIRHPLIRGHLHDPGGMYSSDGLCRPYDHLGSGIVSGDGAGAVVLRRFYDAVAAGDHIHAIICGSAINNDGARKATFSAPSVAGQVDVATTALEVADIDPSTIGFIEGHGTGTPMGDPIEIAALTKVWNAGSRSARPCILGSVKSNLGHLDAASGMAGFIKAVLSVEHGYIPATLNYAAPNPHSELADSPFVVSAKSQEWGRDGVRRASVHCLGMGGTNAHLVLEQALLERPRTSSEHLSLPVVLPVSTRCPQTMRAYIESLANAVEPFSAEVASLARTLQCARINEPYRHVVFGRSAKELASNLRSLKEPIHAVGQPRLIIAFSADGKLNRAALEDLSGHFPTMRAQLQMAATHLRATWGIELESVLRSSEALPFGILPVNVALGVALYAVLQEFGAGGDMVLGQSLGEITAAAASGLITLEDALDFAMARERAFRSIESTGALAVNMSPEELCRVLPADIELSVVNSPTRCVVSGQNFALAAFAAMLQARDIPVQRLEKISAVHSSLLDPVVDGIRTAAGRLRPRDPARTFLSTVGSAQIGLDTASTAEHWVRHFRDPVRFDSCIRRAVSSFEDCIVLDVGPAGGLLPAIRETVSSEVREVVGVLPLTGDVSGIAAFAEALGRLWTQGVEINWRSWPRVTTQQAQLPVPPLLPTVFESFGGWRRPEDEFTEPESERTGEVRIWTRTWRRLRESLDNRGRPRRMLLLPAANDFCQKLATRLESLGHGVHVPDSTRPWEQGGDFDIVVDARALGDADGPATTASFLAVVATMTREPNTARRVVALTRGAFDIVGSEKLSLSSAALACGVVVAAQEHRELDVACIDIEDDANVDLVARLLTSEATFGPTVGVRLRSLWRPMVEVLKPQNLEPKADITPKVCVITGGLGRYGRWVGRWLAENGCRRLLIVSRSRVVSAQAYRAIGFMRDAGCDVTLETCDVTDRDRFVRVLDEAARLDFDGAPTIFHLAAALNVRSAFAPIVDLERDDIDSAVREQWAAKVGGALILRDWARTHRKARCVLFSSTSAVLGGPGLAAYSAANAALDALASAARNDDGLDWCSIGWDGWRFEDDEPESSTRTSAALEAVALKGREAWDALNASMAARCGHVVAAKGNFEHRYRLWIEEASIHDPERTLDVRSISDGAYGESNPLMVMRRIWSDALGSLPDDDADLFNVGGDSLTALRIRSRIERELGNGLTLKAILENRTISKLTALVEGSFAHERTAVAAQGQRYDDEGSARTIVGRV